MKRIYLDHAAATPMANEVIASMMPYLQQNFYNPSATYQVARKVAADIDQARKQVAHWLGAKSSEIIFMAGGTEANNLAIHGVMRQFPNANVLTSSIEHESILKSAEIYKHKQLAVDKTGLIDLERLAKAVDDQTVLVSVMYANNEIGTIQPIAKVAQILKIIRRQRREQGSKLPLYLHTDACQAGAYLDLSVSRIGVDLLTINGGKIYGPKQSAALYIRAGLQLQPQILGGGQERGLRSGTENVANVIGLARALDLAQNNRHQANRSQTHLRDLFIDLLTQSIPDIQINGHLRQRLPNNVHITIPGTDNERVMMLLDEHGVECAVGSACSASNDEPSHVLTAIGLSETLAQSSLRFSLGNSTTENDIRRSVKTLSECLRA